MLKPQEYFLETRGSDCEWCDERTASHRHHAFYKRWAKIDEEENIAWLCSRCHIDQPHDDYAPVPGATVDSRRFREWFWKRQCMRYGTEHMIDWHEGLDLKTKERYYD